MSRDDAHFSDRWLDGARASAEPGAEDAARNLAGIEARLGVALDVGSRLGRASGVRDASAGMRDASAGAPAPEAAGTASRSRLAAERAALRAPARELLPAWHAAFVKAGLVLSFGLATGVVGYWLGRTESTRRSEVTALEAAPAQTAGELSASGLSASGLSAGELSAGELATDGRGAPLDASETSPSSASAAPVGVETLASTPGGSGRVSVRARPRAQVGAAPGDARADTAPRFGLSDALELLRHAEAAVRRGDGLEARMWLGDLDRRAPRELLLEERLVTLTLADCVLGDAMAAGETLSQLERANPQSIYRARLEGSCVAERLHDR